jgi:hypothetical protein
MDGDQIYIKSTVASEAHLHTLKSQAPAPFCMASGCYFRV